MQRCSIDDDMLQLTFTNESSLVDDKLKHYLMLSRLLLLPLASAHKQSARGAEFCGISLGPTKREEFFFPFRSDDERFFNEIKLNRIKSIHRPTPRHLLHISPHDLNNEFPNDSKRHYSTEIFMSGHAIIVFSFKLLNSVFCALQVKALFCAMMQTT